VSEDNDNPEKMFIKLKTEEYFYSKNGYEPLSDDTFLLVNLTRQFPSMEDKKLIDDMAKAGKDITMATFVLTLIIQLLLN